MIKRLQSLRPMPATASEWFAARHGGRSDPAFERAFEEWLMADHEHQRQFALCEIVWDLSRGLAAESPRRADPGAPKRVAAPRRRLVLAGGLAACLAVAAMGLWFTGAVTGPQAVRYATGAGEQRIVPLADGSLISLNTRTEIEATIARGRREVVLKSGEAYFDVAQDPSRPFLVLTSLGQVKVMGTRFGVYLRQQSLEVATEQGLVQVSSAGLPESTARVFVRSGESAVIAAPGARPMLLSRPSDLDRIDNWRHQRLEFDDVPLAELLEEFSRYTAIPLQPANADVGALRVSGVFHIGDVAALSTTLNGAFGLVVRNSGNAALIVDCDADRNDAPCGSPAPPN